MGRSRNGGILPSLVFIVGTSACLASATTESFAVVTGLFGSQEIVTASTHYLSGALALAASLIDNGVNASRVILTTHDVWKAIPPAFGEKMKLLWEPEFIDNIYCTPDEQAMTSIYPAAVAQHAMKAYPVMCTKLNAFRLVQFSKVLYIDTDAIVVGDINPLFRIRADLAAASDPCTQYIFNCGVLLLKPDLGTFNALVDSARSPGSFDGGDQGVLNVFFGTQWQMAAVADRGKVIKLSQAYNAPPMLGLTWNGLGKVLGGVLSRDHGLPDGILMENRIIHFMGVKEKPWVVLQPFMQLVHTDARRAWATLENVPNPEVYIKWVDYFNRAMAYAALPAAVPLTSDGNRYNRQDNSEL